jgi:hypothetical protein
MTIRYCKCVYCIDLSLIEVRCTESRSRLSAKPKVLSQQSTLFEFLDLSRSHQANALHIRLQPNGLAVDYFYIYMPRPLNIVISVIEVTVVIVVVIGVAPNGTRAIQNYYIMIQPVLQ